MVGSVLRIVEEMENGVYDFCVDGKCSGCGQCCSALLPVSEKELRIIKRYVEKNHLKPHKHMEGMPLAKLPDIDLTCPFLDTGKKDKKCDIYDVRPEICRVFQCNQPPSTVQRNRDKFWKTRKPFYMWCIFEKDGGRI